MAGYLSEQGESIARVEASRARRLTERIPLLSPKEKEALLREFHPDYRRDTMRPLQLGPNRGDRAPKELADLLEAPSRIDPDRVDLGRVDYETDVLIIGGGGAGTSAALAALDAGARVILTTKLRLGDANTVMAEGGIQAADKANDSPARHFIDVMGGGHYTNVPGLVRALVSDAPGVIRWLERLGVMFDKEAGGTIITRHGGGTSRKRMHSIKDYSGLEIMRTLREEIYCRGVQVLEFSPAVELLLDEEDRAAGALLLNLDTRELLQVRAKSVIVATGGMGRLHIQGFPCTNHYGATADGLVLGYRAGADLLYMDSVQYHPTGAAYPEQILGLLVTEKVRGLGAQLVNAGGDQFINSLETRDVCSSAIIREAGKRGRGVGTPGGVRGVWLDSPMIDLIHGPGTVKRELPAMHRQFAVHGIDISQEPMLVYPTQHYQNGGVRIDEHGRTRVPGLYYAGEAAGGIHGRNRLMGNSLLDILVFGRRAGANAAEAVRGKKPSAGDLDHVRRYHRELEAQGLFRREPSPKLFPVYTWGSENQPAAD